MSAWSVEAADAADGCSLPFLTVSHRRPCQGIGLAQQLLSCRGGLTLLPSCPGPEIGSQRDAFPGDGPGWGLFQPFRGRRSAMPSLRGKAAWQNRMATGDVGSFRRSFPILL